MPLSDMDGLLPALRDAFGLTATWQRPDTGELVPIQGRFRTDPVDVPLGVHDGLNTTTSWFYCDTRDVPSADRKPGQGDYLLIRNEWFEIVQLNADDIGELGYRLIKGAVREPSYPGEDQGADG
jgi:hypothetical protein